LSYTFIPLSTIAFPHITIFCLTARRMAQFRRTVIFYPLCILAIWLPCVFLGVAANAMRDVPRVASKLEARQALAAAPHRCRPTAHLRRQAERRRGAIISALRAALARRHPGRGHHGAVMASDSNPRALDDVHRGRVCVLRRHAAIRRTGAGGDGPCVCRV
jgi:hypothetical protein